MVSKKMLLNAYGDGCGFFYREDIKLNDDLFEEAVSSLIEEGKIESEMDKSGQMRYRLTPLGIVCGELEFHKPKVIN